VGVGRQPLGLRPTGPTSPAGAGAVHSEAVWFFSQGSLGSLEGSLRRYRVMATIVGVGLAVLCFVGLPLQYAAGIPQIDGIVGPIHGFFYIVYLVTALDLARRCRFSLPDLLMMVGAGLVPLMAFVVERRVTRSVRAGVRPWRSQPLDPGVTAPPATGAT
jgi:integral membrane protein